MKFRSRKLPLVVLTAVGLAALIFGYVIHLRPKRAVARYKAGLMARGEKLTVSELTPLPVMPASNSVATYQRAIQLLRSMTTLLATNRPEAMRMVASGRAMVGWQQPNIVDVLPKTPVTNDWAELAAVVANRREALTLLHTLIEQPTLDWQLQYREGFTLLLPHLAPAKSSAQCLQAATLLALREHRTAEAVSHLRTMLALVKSSRDERLIISQLVRIAIAHVAFATTWSALQSPELDDAQLAALQQDWLGLAFAMPMENALAMERAMAEMTMERMRNSSAEFKKVSSGLLGGGGRPNPPADASWLEQAGTLVGHGWDATRRKAKESAWRASWSLTDELTALQGHQVMLDAIRLGRSNGCYQAAILTQRAELARLGITNKTEDDFQLFGSEPDLRTIFSDTLVSVGRTIDRVMVSEAARELMVAGIALRRFQLRHGRYPEQLAQLAPEFLPEVPRDAVDGKPLRYRPTDAGSFVLYSIGDDGTDDGGDAANPRKEGTQVWQKGRDWVWPQPASAAEIAVWFHAETRKSAR